MKKMLLSAMLVLGGTVLFAKDGVYLEFKISSQVMKGTSKTYESDGNTRTEVMMSNGGTAAPITTTNLILAANPHTSYSLNEKDKTYTVTDVNKSEGQDDYDIEAAGTEVVNGYRCIHVIVTYKKYQRNTEMWLSKDVPGYSSVAHAYMNQVGGTGFYDKLKAKGADGFVVRMLTKGTRGGEAMQMDLVKAEQKNIDASLFSLSGYTKSATPAVMTNEQMRQMTPDQRAEYLKQMREKYKR